MRPVLNRPIFLIIRFHEIGLKGKNLPLFVRHLVENLRRATLGLGVEEIQSVRMMVKLKLSPKSDSEIVINAVKKVFGTVKISPAVRIDPTYDLIC